MRAVWACLILALALTGCATRERSPSNVAPPSGAPPANTAPANASADTAVSGEMAFHPDDLKPFLEMLGNELQGLDAERAAEIAAKVRKLKPGEKARFQVPVQYEGVEESLTVLAEMGQGGISVVRLQMDNPGAMRDIDRFIDNWTG